MIQAWAGRARADARPQWFMKACEASPAEGDARERSGACDRLPIPHRWRRRVRAAWPAPLAAAGQTPGLWPERGRRRDELLPRVAAYYTQLQALPRRVRRALQRQLRPAPGHPGALAGPGAAARARGHDYGRGRLYAGGRHHGGQHRHRHGRVSGRERGRHHRAAAGQHADPDHGQQRHLWAHGAAGDQQCDHDRGAGEHDCAGEWGAGVPAARGEQHGRPDAAGDHGEWGCVYGLFSAAAGW